MFSDKYQCIDVYLYVKQKQNIIMMTRKTIFTVMLLVSFGLSVFAQRKGVTVKINDLDKVTTTVQNATSSSSSSCNTSDFPVYQGTELKDVDIADLKWISVRHDLTPSDPNYVKLELTFKDGGLTDIKDRSKEMEQEREALQAIYESEDFAEEIDEAFS